MNGLDRVPPQDEKAECAVLGAILMDENPMHIAIEKGLAEEDFYHPTHRKIFEVFSEMYAYGKPIDLITASSKFREMGYSDLVTEINRFVDIVPEPHRIGYYIDIIKDKSMRRNVIKNAREVEQMAYDESEQDAEAVVAEAQSKFFGLAKMTETPTTNTEALNTVIEQWENAALGKQPGLPCFLNNVNGQLGNFRKGKVYIAGATPGAGKSTLMQNQFSHWAVEMKIPCAINSIEMDHSEFMGRIVAEMSDQSTYVLSRGLGGVAPARERMARILEASKRIVNIDTGEMVAPLWINDRQMSVEELVAWTRFMVAKHKIEAIGIDYLQILHPGAKFKAHSKREEVMHVVDCLRRMAKELNIVVFVLSQLTKDGRDDRKPRASDLKESSEIQDAAYAIFLLYEWEGIWYCEIAKNRGGPTGAIPCHFAKDKQRWMQTANEPRPQ